MEGDNHPYAVLVGADDVRGLYAARSLSRHDVPLIGILKERWSPAGWSRLFGRILTADTDTTEVIDLLVELGPTFDRKPVLIPCFDTTVVLVARHRDRLDPWYHILQPDPWVVDMMMNKVNFYRYAIEHDLPIPQTSFLETRDDVVRAIEAHDFPVVVKPPGSKHPDWQAKTHLKALKSGTPAELEAIFDEYGDVVDGPLIVQDWVEGGDEALFACHVCFGRDSEPLVTFTSRKIRQWPPHTGEVSLAVEEDSPAVRRIAVRLFRKLGYRGIGYVETKRDPKSGEFFIIEPNLRISGRAGLAEASGVPLIYTLYRHAIGAPLPEGATQPNRGAKWMFARKDFQSAFYYLRTRQLSPLGWLKSISGVRADGIWAWRDPGPFLGDLLRGVFLTLSTTEREKRDFQRPLRRYNRGRRGTVKGREDN